MKDHLKYLRDQRNSLDREIMLLIEKIDAESGASAEDIESLKADIAHGDADWPWDYDDRSSYTCDEVLGKTAEELLDDRWCEDDPRMVRMRADIEAKKLIEGGE